MYRLKFPFKKLKCFQRPVSCSSKISSSVCFIHLSLRSHSMCFQPLQKCLIHHNKTRTSRLVTTGLFTNNFSIFSPRCLKKGNDNEDDGLENTLFIPVPVKMINNPDDMNIGEELSGRIGKEQIATILSTFYKRKPIRDLSQENGLEFRLFRQAFSSFRKYCLEMDSLPVELHLKFSDILKDASHIDDIFPYFMKHAREVFPHLDCMEELRNISDVRVPANWYPEARAINRKIIFHAGPTNSGKTYHALERFFSAKTGVYCGPLKLLAVEIHNKSKERDILCDLITGEERRFCNADGTPASHVSCTVEMTSISTPYEVAIIDEIQMLRDVSRGWAWTRALLGVVAQEIHVCGEEAAIDIVQKIMQSVSEDIEICHYKRLTKLSIEDKALVSLDNVRPGDCIVCFSKNDIFSVSLLLDRKGIECAVVYGALPPGTKLAQSQKFNDPSNSCKVLVATDAIGMGLNLSIKRVIFNTIIKPNINEKGEKEMDCITTSQALQIGGRAGRYGTQYETGYVTTFSPEDLPLLKNVMSQAVDPITAAGLLPTAEQLELFAYHLPHASMSNLVDIFISLCQLDLEHYFMCQVDNFKFLADMIQHIPLTLNARYVFCCAPINTNQTLVCTMFLKFTRQYSRNEPITFDWLCRQITWPFTVPRNVTELIHLEAVFDTLDIYLWLSYRFQDLFLDGNLIRDMQKELDLIIQQGIFNITTLLKASETRLTSAMTKTHVHDYVTKKKKEKYKTEVEKHTEVADPSSILGKIKLSDRLVAQGLLSPEMLKQLKKEMMKENIEPENERKTVSKRGRKK